MLGGDAISAMTQRIIGIVSYGLIYCQTRQKKVRALAMRRMCLNLFNPSVKSDASVILSI